MAVLSITPVEEVSSGDNLFPEGDFEDWWAGAPNPSGRYVPPGPASGIERVAGGEPGSGRGQYALKQTWAQPDSRFNELGRFGFHVEPLEPYAEYKLSLEARTNSAIPVQLTALGQQETDGPMVPLAIPLLSISQSEAWQPLEARFVTGVLPRIVFTTALTQFPESDEAPFLLIDNIHVEKIADGQKPESPAPDAGSLIANGSFELWPNGVAIPLGKYQGPDAEFSRIEPFMTVVKDGKIALHQVWEKGDGQAPPSKLFGVTAVVEPNKKYRFQCVATRPGESVAQIEVYGKKADGFQAIAAPLFLLDKNANNFSAYEGSFDSGPHDTVLIVSRAAGIAANAANRILWDLWQLAPEDS
ncbi:MAG: hypothetical protein GC168_10975 [Candidatus Hydrogenedens sp.]|nr:hypothetical protein [Candidatus Hydrogenedens sp.]